MRIQISLRPPGLRVSLALARDNDEVALPSGVRFKVATRSIAEQNRKGSLSKTLTVTLPEPARDRGARPGSVGGTRSVAHAADCCSFYGLISNSTGSFHASCRCRRTPDLVIRCGHNAGAPGTNTRIRMLRRQLDESAQSTVVTVLKRDVATMLARNRSRNT
jgi:hypothetical protein